MAMTVEQIAEELDNLSLLRSEVLALRREVDTLRHGGLARPTGTQEEKR